MANGGFQTGADLREMLGKNTNAFVNTLAEFADLLRVAGDLLLPPAIGNSTKKRNEGGGCGKDDLFVCPSLNEFRALLQGGAEEGFSRQK